MLPPAGCGGGLGGVFDECCKGSRAIRRKRGVDVAGEPDLAVALEPKREPAPEAVRAGQNAKCRPQDGERREIRVARQARPQACAQERRFAGPRSRLDDEQARRAPFAQGAQLGDAGHDVRLAAEEDAGIVLCKGQEAWIRSGFALWRPGETARRDAEMSKPRFDRIERRKVEFHALHLAIVLERFHAFGWLGGKIRELAVGVAGKPGIVFLKVPQDRNDNLLAEVLRKVHFPLAFLGAERIRRGQQDHRLAGGIGFAQRIAPALARADAVQVDEDVFLTPAVCHQPALEGEGLHIVLARMTDK